MIGNGLYHVGIVVPDLEVASARLSDILGVEWGPIMESSLELRNGDGTDVVVPNRARYSTQPPHLELIEETPGTVWVCNPYSNLHHIGFFSDDLRANARTLSSLRCPLEVMGRDGDRAPVTFTYHHDELGVRIEHVDASLREGLQEFAFRRVD